MKPTPLQAIIVGLAVAVFGVGWLIAMLLNPPGRLTPDQLSFFEGSAASSGDVVTKRGYSTLEIWIGGEPIPFRCFDGPYPGSFDQSALARLEAGKHVKIGVLTSELKSPRTNLAQGQSFYSFVSLDVEGQPALTLEAYNLWERKNLQTGLVVIPLLTIGGAYYLWAGLAARREGRPTV